MKSIVRIAVAATIFVALAGLACWLVFGGGAKVAFAQVAEALLNVQKCELENQFATRAAEPGADHRNGSRQCFLAPSHERKEETTRGNTEISIFDGQGDKAIALNPAAKTAVVIELKNLPSKKMVGRTFEDLREMVAKAVQGQAGDVKQLGVQTIDGRQAQGFRFRQGSIEVDIWADPKTLLPLRVEETFNSETNIHIVMSDFQVNPALDSSLFSVEVPPGYTLQHTAQIDLSRKPITYLAGALKAAAEFKGGVFPSDVVGNQGLTQLLPQLRAALEKKYGKDSPEMFKAASDLSMDMAGAFAILHSLPKDAWHYAGKDVKLNEPNKLIFWMRSKKHGYCDAIYADLSVKELPKSELPQTP